MQAIALLHLGKHLLNNSFRTISIFKGMMHFKLNLFVNYNFKKKNEIFKTIT